MKKMLTVILGLGALALFGCGGGSGSGGGSSPSGTAPTLQSAAITPNSALAGSTVAVQFQYAFSDPDGDLDGGAAWWTSTSGQNNNLVIPGSFAGKKSGTGSGTVVLVNDQQKGTFQVPVWLTDRAGNKSNVLVVTWTQT